MKVFAIQNTQTNTYTPQFKQNNSQTKTFTRPMAIKDTVAFGMPKVHIETADADALRGRLEELAELLKRHLDSHKRQRFEAEQAKINARLAELEPHASLPTEEIQDSGSDSDSFSRHFVDDLTHDGYRF